MPEPRAKSIYDSAYLVLVECLRKARLAAGLTQTELADRLGVDQSYVSKYERAERRLDIVEVRALCHEFNLSLADFVTRFERQLKRKKSP
jgi:transcriptional regulator with XRE-family HTH domain